VITAAWHEFGAEGPDLVVAHSLGTVVRGVAEPPNTTLPVDMAIHVYDNGDLIAGGKPISPPFGGITDRAVENKAFPTSHDVGPYAKAAADAGVFAELVA
jgi:hypothetical protein